MPTRLCRGIAAPLAAAGLAVAGPALAQGCNTPAKDAVAHVALPGPPFAVTASPDGCAVFVSLSAVSGQPGRIAVLSRSGGQTALVRTVETKGSPAGMATGGANILAVADGGGVLLYDIARLVSGEGDPLAGTLDEGAKAASVAVAFTPDGRLLFVSDQGPGALGVWDVAQRKRLGAAPVGPFPGGLAVSPDGEYLYATVRFVDGKAPDCSPEDGQGSWTAPGDLVAVSVAKAAADPRSAVASRTAVGCAPTRVALSPRGDLAYVAARGDDAVAVVRTDVLFKDRAHAVAATVKAGTTPAAVAATGRFVFAPNSDNTITVLGAGSATVKVGTIPLSGLPHDAAVTADGGTLLVAGAAGLDIIDLARLGDFRN